MSGTVDMKLEVVVIPASDVDRAKRFYQGLGWREDVDIAGPHGYRAVHLTPPGSSASILIGNKGVTLAEPGSIAGWVRGWGLGHATRHTSPSNALQAILFRYMRAFLFSWNFDSSVAQQN